MSDGVITDAQITASSEWNPVSHSVSFGRLYNKAGSGAWVVRISDLSQWIQVDVGRQRTRITRIATQGRYNYPQWVTKYSLQVSNDGENFQYYKEQDQTTNKVPYNSENNPLCLKAPLTAPPPPPNKKVEGVVVWQKIDSNDFWVAELGTQQYFTVQTFLVFLEESGFHRKYRLKHRCVSQLEPIDHDTLHPFSTTRMAWPHINEGRVIRLPVARR